MKERYADHDIPEFMKQINERVRVEARRKLRKLVAIIVVLCLFFGMIGFVCGRASANNFQYGSEVTFSRDLFDSSDWTSLYDYVVTYLSDHTEFQYMALCNDPRFWQNNLQYWAIVVCTDPILNWSSGASIFTEFPDSEILYFGNNSYDHSVYSYSYGSAGSSDSLYQYSPLVGGNFRQPAFNYGTCWNSSDNFVGSKNLIVPQFAPPDNRSLTASKVYLTDNYYLQVEAYPAFASDFGYVTLTYYDTLGTFTKTLSRSDGIRVSEVGEDASNSFVTLTINPNLVSQYKFTVTGVDYVSSGDFGSKSVLQLDLIFNEDPFPMPSGWDSINSYSTYNSYSSIGVVGGGIATFEIGFLNNNQSLLSWRESSGKVHQPFRLSWIVLPDFLWDYGAFQFADFNLEEMYQLFESYDVVILGVGPSFFNDLYPDHVDPAGVKDNYDFVKSAWQLGLGVDYCISVIDGFESPYRSCNRADSDEVFTITRSSRFGFIWTRNFLLKQISWYCGDTSERLLELESRLVDENDGALTSIQEKLNYLYEDNNGFINDCLHSLSDISYALNNLDVGALGDISLKLDRIIDYFDFNIDIDVTKLARPWSDIFLFTKRMFDDSVPMWDSISSSASTLYDGLPVSNQYDVESLPDISGPIPLFPTIAPIPVIPTFSPTPVPIGAGG